MKDPLEPNHSVKVMKNSLIYHLEEKMIFGVIPFKEIEHIAFNYFDDIVNGEHMGDLTVTTPAPNEDDRYYVIEFIPESDYFTLMECLESYWDRQ